jgi:hypothetical protein
MIGSVDGRAILRAAIHCPRVGVWHADVELEGEEGDELDGAVELEFDAITWSGTVRRGGLDNGRLLLLVVGGAGGLELELEPKYYVDAASSLPLDDIMRECGETLSSTASSAARSTQLAKWTRRRERGGVALHDLAAVLGLDWRVLPDGSVWLGTEAWTAAELVHDVLEDDPARAYRRLGVDAPTLTPGSTLDGRRVSYVLHTIEPRAVRSEVWLEPTSAREPARTARWLERFLDRVLRRVDRTALYPARVVQQSGDGTLEVQIDDQRWPSLTKVPIRPFVPGATVKVAAGARVHIGWEEGDPRKPYAALWDSGELQELQIDTQTKAKITGPLVELADASQFATMSNLVLTELQKIQTTLNSATAPSGGGPVTYGTPYVPASVAASKVKIS